MKQQGVSPRLTLVSPRLTLVPPGPGCRDSLVQTPVGPPEMKHQGVSPRLTRGCHENRVQMEN